MLVYSKQISPVFEISRHSGHHHQANKRPGHGDNNLSELEIFVRDPNSRTFASRKQHSASKMDKYLPRLESSERIRSSNDIKRNCNVNLTRQSSPARGPSPKSNMVVHLPGISPTRRKSSISDSTNTTSTSSIPSIEISEPAAHGPEETELLIPFQGDSNFIKISQNLFQKSKICDPDRLTNVAVPHPPRSPRPTETNLSTNTKSFHNNRRTTFIKRSQHFELTLQNIEEVKDLENDSPIFGKHSDAKSMILGERECVAQDPSLPGIQRITGHQRSHSTPVDYRELKNRIDATRLVSMADMSVEFTRHYLAGKGNEQESEEDIRHRCISWLNSLK